MAYAPRGVDPRRLPAEWSLPVLHLAWLPKGGATGTSNAPTGPDHRTPPRPEARGGGGDCSRTSPTAGLECPASMNPVSRMNTPSRRGVPVPRPNTVPGFALASHMARTGPPTMVEALAGSLAERAHMGATASSIQGFTSAVHAVEDLQWIPPAVTTLHKRIAAGAASAGPQPYLPPARLVILVENATKSRYGPLLRALATLGLCGLLLATVGL